MTTTSRPGRGGRVRIGAAVAAIALLAGGCAATHPTAPTATGSSSPVATPSVPISTSPATVASYYAIPVARIAGQVPGCDNGPTLTVADVLARAAALGPIRARLSIDSATECTLRGAGVLILGFADPARQAASQAAISSVETYISYGPGWVALATSTTDSTAELSVVQAVAQGLDGRIGIAALASP